MAFDSILSRICIILSLLFIVFIDKNSCVTTSLLDGGLEDVCTLDFKKVIKLKSGEGSAEIIHDGVYLSGFTGRFPFICKFLVRAKDDEGLYVVIQDLNFRENNGECLDYVELSVPANNVAKFLMGAENKRPKRFCGVMKPGMWLDADDDSSSDEEVNLKDKSVAPNAYIAPDGQVAVEIVIDRQRLVDQEKLVIRLAFTSFKKRCSESSYNCRWGECIHSSFFDDDVQNCPYLSCADENGCKKFREKTDDKARGGIGPSVTFGAVGALLLILLKFGLCLWLCKRLQHRRRARQLAAPIAVHPISRQSSVERPQPSAPPAPELETKDLPPSYESLYPNETHN